MESRGTSGGNKPTHKTYSSKVLISFFREDGDREEDGGWDDDFREQRKTEHLIYHTGRLSEEESY